MRKSLDMASSKKSYPSPPASVAKDTEQSQLSRAMALGSYFVSGLFAYANMLFPHDLFHLYLLLAVQDYMSKFSSLQDQRFAIYWCSFVFNQ